ncbi:MAG: alpha-ribazole phosphatase [Dehalococcoidia bacterium]|nr:alpha-ribazole phosphatase [Dehalococcoidia bacterium]
MPCKRWSGLGKWYLVRHAKTAWNAQGRIQGHSESHLEAEGLAQAERLAARLSSVSFHAAYSSDMARTKATVAAILSGRQVPLEITQELRELSYGQWEGMTHQEVGAAFGQEYQEYLRGDVGFAPPGGESAVQLLERLGPFKERLLSSHAGQDLLLVAHGGTIKGLLILLMDMPADLFWRFSVGHASISVINTYKDTATLERWNDISHLESGVG